MTHTAIGFTAYRPRWIMKALQKQNAALVAMHVCFVITLIESFEMSTTSYIRLIVLGSVVVDEILCHSDPFVGKLP